MWSGGNVQLQGWLAMAIPIHAICKIQKLLPTASPAINAFQVVSVAAAQDA